MKRVGGRPTLGGLNLTLLIKLTKMVRKSRRKEENVHCSERVRRRRRGPGLSYRPTVKRVIGKHTRGMYTAVYTQGGI